MGSEVPLQYNASEELLQWLRQPDKVILVGGKKHKFGFEDVLYYLYSYTAAADQTWLEAV